MDLFLIKPKAGFTPQISHLTSMMDYARSTTLQAVHNLTTLQLDYVCDQQANSIGALLAHIAAVEWFYQIFTFEDREPSDEEYKPWLAALELGIKVKEEIKGQSLEYYTKLLDAVRKKTYENFATLDDSWLYKETSSFWNDQPANHYFMWFHVLEDEINHRGQMRFIRKRLPEHLGAS